MSDPLETATPEVQQQVPITEGEAEAQPEENLDGSPSESVQAPVEKIEDKKASGEKLTKKEEQKLREYRLKVNGREKIVKFNPNNDQEVLRYLQKAEASDLKFQEAAAVRQAALEFINDLKSNPGKVLSNPEIGVDLKKFAHQILNDEISEMEKTPEQRDKEKLQRELEQLKKQAQTREEEYKQREFQRLQMEHERTLEADISAALDVGGLPKTPRTVKAMAEMMMTALEHNIDLSARDILPIVKNMTQTEFKEVVSSLSDDQLEDFLGKEVLGRIRKKNLAKAKAIETASSIRPTGNDVKKPDIKKPQPKMTIREWLKV